LNQPSDNVATIPLSERDFKALLHNASGGVAIVDAASGLLLFQNAPATRILRRPPPADGSCRNYLHYAQYEDGTEYAPDDYALTRALRGQPVHLEDMLYRRGDGELALLQINAIPMRDEDGDVKRVFIYFLDISERRRAELALRASEERLEMALSAARIGLWDLNIQTGELNADHHAVAILNLGPGAPTFDTWLGMLHPDDKQNVTDRWYGYLEGRFDIYDAVYRIRTDGDWQWVAAHGQVTERDAHGAPLRATGTLVDVNDLKQAEIQLRDNEELFRCTLEHAAIGLATLLPDGSWVSINPKMGEILGYSTEELRRIGDLRRLIHADDIGRFNEQLDRLLNGQLPSFTLEQRYQRQDGAVIWAILTASIIRSEDGRLKWVIFALMDTTARKEAEQYLHKTQIQLRMATRIARLGFWEWEPATGYCYFSSEWKAQLGYRGNELSNRYEEWERRLHPDDLGRVLDRLFAYVDRPQSDLEQEFRLRHKNGSYRTIVSRGVPLMDARGKLHKMMGIHLDVTDQKRAEESIRQQAQHDALTGLPNRGLLHEFAEQIVAAAHRSGAPLAVLFIDLDRFKAINDQHGHKVGDGVLKEVAHRLNQIRRAEDVVGRLGGDEFVTILPNIHDRHDVATVAGKALECLRLPYHVDGLQLELSPSIGISLLPDDGDNFDVLLQQADGAMYEVKSHGCNNFRFAREHDEIDHGTRAWHSGLELRLRAGLSRREFELHYQPVVDTEDGRVVGVEALVRWRGGEREAQHEAAPSVFIPIAEACGLILPIGEWILRQACRQHRAWIADGLPAIPVAVNVSEVQLASEEFASTVEQVLHDTGIDPAFLELEVKESSALKNMSRTIDVLSDLKQSGLKVALDGCSTGCFDLNQLSRLPLDRLKFDQSLVHQLSCDKAGLAIGEAIIAFGRSLGADVVAEGIESERDLQSLREHHCRQAQGFHLGRPMPAAQFSSWYRQHSMH
jgi:diguanylate cyclase (GGDEF)-like protein/PAS domain S-box-containing protein